MICCVAVGDSITNGYGWPVGAVECRSWAEHVARALALPVLNLAVNGAGAEAVETIQLPRMPEWCELALTMLGANGLTDPGFDVNYPRQYAIPTVLETLAKRADLAVAVTLPTGLRGSRYRERVRRVNEDVRRHCAAFGVLVAEGETAFDGQEWMLGPDRLHLNAAGQIRLAQIVLDTLDGRAGPTEPLPEVQPGRVVPVLTRMLALRRR